MNLHRNWMTHPLVLLCGVWLGSRPPALASALATQGSALACVTCVGGFVALLTLTLISLTLVCRAQWQESEEKAAIRRGRLRRAVAVCGFFATAAFVEVARLSLS